MRRRSILIGLMLLAIVGGATFWTLTELRPLTSDALRAHAPKRANGETLFNIGGCASCHASEVKDPKPEERLRLGGGLAFSTPFGTFKSPNISPDPKFGIGTWTEIQFVNAMMRGIGRNGEHLYPAFPYTSYQRMTLEDVRDLYAYMKTLPPVSTPSQPHQISFPFNVRRGLGLWKLLYLDGKPFAPDPARSAELNRGAYLIEGPGHCAECHSPRNLMGGIDATRRFAGGQDPEGKGYIPNITQHADGIAKWSTEEIIEMLATGFTPSDKVGGSMAEVALNTSLLPPADRNAMAAYLKSLPARPGRPPPKAK